MKIRALLRKLFKMDSKVVSTRENLILLMMAVAAWFVSFTVLLPLIFVLMISSTARKSLYEWNMQYKAEGIEALTKNLFCILRESCPQFDFRKLRFLELGHRVSHNFDEYSEQHEIDVACGNPDLFEKPDIMNKKICFCSEKDVLKNCKENTYDVIVSTFYLCSVQNPKMIVENIYRILKPGGKFAFLEHCGYPENELSHKFQRLIAPFWRIIFGCRLSHHPSRLLMYSSFHSLNFNTFYNRNRLVFYRPVIVGVCTK